MVNVFIYVVVFLGLIVGGFVFYFLDLVWDGIFVKVVALRPLFYTGQEWVFLNAVIKYSPLIVVVIPLLIWMFVNTRRREAVGL